MAAKPEIIRLKYSTDSEASIVAAIAPGGSHPISRGELVIGVEAESAKLYTLSANNIPVPVVSGFPYGVDGGDFDAGSFPVVTGSRLPILGTTAATDYTGWTRVVNETNRTASYLAQMAFDIVFASDSHDSFYVNRNSYITFEFNNVNPIYGTPSASNPYQKKILIDTIGQGVQEYIQRIYIQSNSAYYRIRVEMDSTAGTQPGQSDRIYELTFVNPAYTTNQLIELRTGGTGYFNRTGVTLIASDTSVLYDSATDVLPGESWVFQGNETGTEWEMIPYAHIDIQVFYSVQGRAMITSAKDLACVNFDGSLVYPKGPCCAWPKERNDTIQVNPVNGQPTVEFASSEILDDNGQKIKASLGDMAAGMLRTTVQVMRKGKLDQESRDARYSKCLDCDSFIKSSKRCAECGCFMQAKTWVAGAVCPLGKW